jgi:hypothetical protein
MEGNIKEKVLTRHSITPNSSNGWAELFFRVRTRRLPTPRPDKKEDTVIAAPKMEIPKGENQSF